MYSVGVSDTSLLSMPILFFCYSFSKCDMAIIHEFDDSDIFFAFSSIVAKLIHVDFVCIVSSIFVNFVNLRIEMCVLSFCYFFTKCDLVFILQFEIYPLSAFSFIVVKLFNLNYIFFLSFIFVGFIDLIIIFSVCILICPYFFSKCKCMDCQFVHSSLCTFPSFVSKIILLRPTFYLLLNNHFLSHYYSKFKKSWLRIQQ